MLQQHTAASHRIPIKRHSVYTQVCSLLSLQVKFLCPIFPLSHFSFQLTLFEVWGGWGSIHQLDEHLSNLELSQEISRS